MLGCGNVGSALVGMLDTDAGTVAERTGLRFEVTRVAVHNITKERDVELAPGVVSNDAMAVATADDVDVVVELIGGIEPARSLILAALRAGKPVVSGNKELVATLGEELHAAATAAGVDLYYEAAVGGAIPVLRTLRASLAGERVTRIMGIVNGTTNFILSKMSAEGTGYGVALAEAQELGFAERDPTADVEGYDASAKCAILASTAFGQQVVAGDVYVEGISKLTADDIEFAKRSGYEIKLLAITSRIQGQVTARVHPALVPAEHPLASVHGSFNAAFIEGAAAGDLMLYGRGAGGRPTASAVLGDLINVGRNRRLGVCDVHAPLSRKDVRPIDELVSSYYVSIVTCDEPGVLAAVTKEFGEHRVSIRSMDQRTHAEDGSARIDFITHEATEADVRATLKALRKLTTVRQVAGLLRVVDD